MEEEVVVYKNKSALFSKRSMNYDNKLCNLCGKEILKGLSVYLIMSDRTLFPNVFVHTKCVQSKKECIKQLVSSYERFKLLPEKDKCWCSAH